MIIKPRAYKDVIKKSSFVFSRRDHSVFFKRGIKVLIAEKNKVVILYKKNEATKIREAKAAS